MKITAQMIRDKIWQLDVTQAQVRRATGMPQAWWHRMMQQNRYQFDNPDPKRMETIWNYLRHYEKFRGERSIVRTYTGKPIKVKQRIK